MRKQFGVRLENRPEGFGHRVVFPQLAQLDHWTGDGRRLEADGLDVINLPAPMKLLDHDSEWGHLDSTIVGRLDVITVEDDGLVHGEGWTLDDTEGERAARMVKLKAIRGNSIDLRDVDMRIKWPSMEEIEAFFDGEDEEGFSGPMPKVLRKFKSYKIAGTTLVMMPAFEDASAEIEDELTASWSEWTVEVERHEELTAAGGSETLVPFTDFHIKEIDNPTGHPITVDEDGRVFGHLGLYNSCHTGFLDRCVRIPQSRTGYGSFCSASVLTDNGLVRTGPLFLYGGHPEQRRPDDIARAYGGVENAWADVRVTNGKHGPWISGRVRPGVPDDKVYAARASKISGHWLNGELFAAVSVNAPGFDVPYQFLQEGDDEYLVASFATAGCGCDDENPFAILGGLLADVDD